MDYLGGDLVLRLLYLDVLLGMVNGLNILNWNSILQTVSGGSIPDRII